MHNISDILEKTSFTGDDVRRLNFICDLPTYHFRKYYRQGLRSHIIEVLSAADVLKETKGDIIDGIRMFPRAVPKYMLRILRTRFSTLTQALEEVKKYALLEKFLEPGLMAISNEFIVDYNGSEKNAIILCGLQEYVAGAIFDPWSISRHIPFDTLFRSMFPENRLKEKSLQNAFNSIGRFVKQIRNMIDEVKYIPDLAGYGNLVLTPEGDIKLVDINNIITIEENDTIFLDDKHYPSCDKSVEVLAIMEHQILKTGNLTGDPLYTFYLSTERRKRVRQLEKSFTQKRYSRFAPFTESTG